LEPLSDNLPNMPTSEEAFGKIVRVNDGNDSNVNREHVITESMAYEQRFYNTAIPRDLGSFPGPVVLTVNPGAMTDVVWHKVDPIPKNLMFVRFRANAWNMNMCNDVVQYYSVHDVPVVLTFMAYFIEPQRAIEFGYILRTRTLNSYWAITTAKWREIMARYQDNKWVYSCGRIEGELGDTKCRFCGNCIREYFATKERMEV